jgi:hypothetical protein
LALRNRCEAMRTYRVSIINEHFSASEDQKAVDVTKAWQSAIGSAIAIAADQVSHGNPFFGAEVILDEGSQRIGRYVVSVAAAPLKD